MLRFEHMEYLWLLLFIPFCIMIYFFWYQNKKKQLKKLGDIALVQNMMPQYKSSISKFNLSILLLGIFCIVLSLANLQGGATSQKVIRKGSDLFVLLDVSKSMWAQDEKPNRLEKAKQLIQKLIEKIPNNRLGLILFAGRSYLSVPMTTDISAFKMNLAVASPDIVPTQGTVIGDAIEMAIESMDSKESNYKSILLISDGEDHDPEALKQSKKATDLGIVIHTVAVGSEEGTTIPDPKTGENKKDENGQDIITKVNVGILKEVAHNTQGTFVHLSNTEQNANELATQINNIEQKNISEAMLIDYKSYYPYFLSIGLLLISLQFILPLKSMIKK